jgi:hypothetical protein
MMEGGRRELILSRKLGYGDPHDAGSSIPEGIVCMYDCQLHNNDVLTEFKKPLPQKKQNAPKVIVLALSLAGKCSRVIARV